MLRSAVLFIVFMASFVGYQSLALSARNPASTDLVDVNYSFDKTKVKAAPNSFHFMRSFVDYYYLLLAKNQDLLPTVSGFKSFSGWCAGDAHAENFGVLLQKNNGYVFTINDVDDAGPCPVAYDLFRLMASSQLYTPNLNYDRILTAYISGVSGGTYAMPEAVKALYADAQQKGRSLNPKKLKGNSLKRDKESEELDKETLADLQKTLDGILPGMKLVDAFRTAKVGGGSGGLTRYELLVRDTTQVMQLEFKEQTTPAIYPVAAGPVPDTRTRLAKSLAYEQGSQVLPFYGYVQFQGMDMLVRPILWGNEGVSLDASSEADNLEIIYYEAFTLGMVHRRSLADADKYVNLLKSLPAAAWKQEALSMADLMDRKFQDLSR